MASAVDTGTNKELSKINAMIKQLADSVTDQVATVATLSTNMNGGSSGAGKKDRKKARPGLQMCAHCKRKVYHKGGNYLDLEANREKRYPGWKRVLTKEQDDRVFAGSILGIQSWFHKLKLKPNVQLGNYYTPLTSKVE